MFARSQGGGVAPYGLYDALGLVQNANTVLKSRVIGAGKYVSSQSQLANAAEPLQEGRIHQNNFTRFEPYRPPNRIVNYFGRWLTAGSAETTRIILKIFSERSLKFATYRREGVGKTWVQR